MLLWLWLQVHPSYLNSLAIAAFTSEMFALIADVRPLAVIAFFHHQL
jgi:hypothetical protein